jgi:hypothetical protein
VVDAPPSPAAARNYELDDEEEEEDMAEAVPVKVRVWDSILVDSAGIKILLMLH